MAVAPVELAGSAAGQPLSVLHAAAIFGVGLLARLLFLQTPQVPVSRLSADAYAYFVAARHLLADSMRPSDWAHLASRGPGYVSFLAGLMAAFGEDPQTLRCAQAGVGALTAAVVYALGCAVGARSIGILAGLATALWPSLILHTGLLHTETLATLLLWSGIALLVRGASGRGGLIAAAGVLGAACLTRPTFLPMTPWLVGAVFVSPPVGTLRRRAGLSLTFAAVLLLPLLSWNLTARALGQNPVAGSAGVRVMASAVALATDPQNRGWSPDAREESRLTPHTGIAHRLAAVGNLVFTQVWYSDNVWRQSFALSPSRMNIVQRVGLLFGFAGMGLALLRWRAWAPILAVVIGLAMSSVKWIEPRPVLPFVPAVLLLGGLFVHTLAAALRRSPGRTLRPISSAALVCAAAVWLAQGPPATGAVLWFLEPVALGTVGVVAVIVASFGIAVLLFRLWRPELGAVPAAVASATPALAFAPLFLGYAIVGSDPRSRKFEIDLGRLAEPLTVEIHLDQPIPAAQLKSAGVLLDLASPTYPPKIELAVDGRSVSRDVALWHQLSCRPVPAVEGHPFSALEREGEGSPMCAVYEALGVIPGRPMTSWPQWWLVHIDEAQVADKGVVRLSLGPGRWKDQERVVLGGAFTTPGSTAVVGPAIHPKRMSIYRFEVLDDWRLWDETKSSSARRSASLGPSEPAGRYLARRLQDGSAQVGVRLVARLRDGRILYY